jgi:hypothetical protein
LPIYDVIWVWPLIITVTSEVIVDLCNPLLHSTHEDIKLAHAIPAVLAAMDTREWDDPIVDDPADMGRLASLLVAS